MNDKTSSPIVYEFYYTGGSSDFRSCYRLQIDRETTQMLYGVVYENKSGSNCGRFALNKGDLDCTTHLKNGTVVARVREASVDVARQKAKQLVQAKLMEWAQRLCS